MLKTGGMFITVKPAARILDLSEGRVRILADRGELPVILTESGLRLFDKEAVERVAAERKARRTASRGEAA
jgi:predicted site-specific integrase-resolvase